MEWWNEKLLNEKFTWCTFARSLQLHFPNAKSRRSRRVAALMKLQSHCYVSCELLHTRLNRKRCFLSAILGFSSSVSWVTGRGTQILRLGSAKPAYAYSPMCWSVCASTLTVLYLYESQDDIEPTLDSSSNGTWANWSVFYTSGSVPVIGVHATYTDFSPNLSASFSSVFRSLHSSRSSRRLARNQPSNWKS